MNGITLHRYQISSKITEYQNKHNAIETEINKLTDICTSRKSIGKVFGKNTSNIKSDPTKIIIKNLRSLMGDYQDLTQQIQESSLEQEQVKNKVEDIREKIFLIKFPYKLKHFLIDEENCKKLIDHLELKNDNIFSDLKKHISENRSIKFFVTACIHAAFQEHGQTIEDYLNLAEMHFEKRNMVGFRNCIIKTNKIFRKLDFPHASLNFLEKLNPQWDAFAQQDEELKKIFKKKNTIRRIFKTYCSRIKRLVNEGFHPKCFICFAIGDEDKDVKKWLNETLIEDLKKIGIRTVISSVDLQPGQDIKIYEKTEIPASDQIIVVCTPLLKSKCEDPNPNPGSVKEELDLICARAEKKPDTTFFIYLKGSRSSSLPSICNKTTFGTKIGIFDDQLGYAYYSTIFELFGALKGLSRKHSNKISLLFSKYATDFLNNYSEKEDPPIDISKDIDTIKEILFVLPEKYVPRRPPRQYIARDLDTKLNGSKRCIVYGLRGIGKRSLVRKFAEESKEKYSEIYWINWTSDVQKHLQEYGNFLSYLTKSEEPVKKTTTASEIWKSICQELEALSAQKPWLLILDNIEDNMPDLPKAGIIIGISNCKPKEQDSSGVDFDKFVLGPFSPAQSEFFLDKKLSIGSQEQKKQLAERLNHIPFALEIAAHQIKAGEFPIDDFLNDLNKDLALVLDYEKINSHTITIRSIWQEALVKLNEVNADCRKWLNVSAYLSNLIPKDWIAIWANLQKHKNPYITKRDIIVNLLDFGFAFSSTNPSYFFLYSLIQEMIRNMHTDDEKRQYSLNAFKLLINTPTNRDGWMSYARKLNKIEMLDQSEVQDLEGKLPQ